jgi:hypothetical protein
MKRSPLSGFLLALVAIFSIGWVVQPLETYFKSAVHFASTIDVTGTTALTGQVTFAAPNKYSLTPTVTAAGTSKTDCTALTTEYSTVSTATALQGVCLLTAVAKLHQKVKNITAVSIIVYPLDAGNDTLAVDGFAALAADAGYVLPPQASLDCVADDGTAWECTATRGLAATVAAAGTNQATGTALTSVNMNAVVNVTGADGTVGITLPTGALSGCIEVFSSAITSALKVYGHNSDDDTIAGGAADAVFAQTARTKVRYCTVDGIAWLTY